MLLICIVALYLCLHMVNLKRKYGETVYGPSRTLCIYGSIFGNLYILVHIQPITVYHLHKVCSLLIGFVYAPLKRKCSHRVYVRVSYYILQMPLHCINPILKIEEILYTPEFIRIIDWRIHVIRLVVICNRLLKDTICLLCKIHIA